MINICLWMLAGALVGGAASRIPSALAPDDVVINMIAGTLGALFGGVVFMTFDITLMHVVNPWAFVLALCSAVIAISLARLAFQRLI